MASPREGGQRITRSQETGVRGASGVPGGAPVSGSGSGQRQLEVGTEDSIVPRLLPWALVLLAGSDEP